MSGGYQAIYLSPHPDDAVFSCAGTIAKRADRGDSVLVVTVCTSAPRTALATPFAASLHQRWNLEPSQVVHSRLSENDAALATLGVDGQHLGFLDAIYRRSDVYDSRERLFGDLAPSDPLPAELARAVIQLCARYPRASLYAPLGVARHVDHQAAHFAARAAERQRFRVIFYEDLPYATEPGSVERQLAHLGLSAVAIPHAEDVEAYLPDKLAAMRCYASQIQDLPKMPEEAVAYARSLSPNGRAVERVWSLSG